jgi:hypothetical protein
VAELRLGDDRWTAPIDAATRLHFLLHFLLAPDLSIVIDYELGAAVCLVYPP